LKSLISGTGSEIVLVAEYSTRHLKGNGVFLSESLTKTRLEVQNYAKAKFGMKSVWSSGG